MLSFISIKNNKMKKLLSFLILISIFFASCNSTRLPFTRTEKIRVFSQKAGAIIYNQDTIILNHKKKEFIFPENYNLILKVPKSKEPLNFSFIGEDSLVKDYVIIPKNLIPAYKDPIPDRSYSYATNLTPVILPSKDTIEVKTKSFKRPEKGSVYLNISLPHVNFYDFNIQNRERVTKNGFLGFSLGLDYYHSKNQFLNLSYSAIQDFFMVFPAPVDYEDVDLETFLWSKYFSLSNNHRMGRLTFGYGFSYAENNYNLPLTNREKYYAFGNVFSTYFQLSKAFHLGVIYRPTYYRPQLSDEYQYEHAISIDFMWKIRLK